MSSEAGKKECCPRKECDKEKPCGASGHDASSCHASCAAGKGEGCPARQCPYMSKYFDGSAGEDSKMTSHHPHHGCCSAKTCGDTSEKSCRCGPECKCNPCCCSKTCNTGKKCKCDGCDCTDCGCVQGDGGKCNCSDMCKCGENKEK